MRHSLVQRIYRVLTAVYDSNSVCYSPLMRLALLRDPTEQGYPWPHLKTEADPVSETLCFVVLKIADD
jgi:hypothetical protein